MASQDTFDYNINNIKPANFDLDTKKTPSSLQQEFTIKTLILAYHFIAISWYKEYFTVNKYIPSLLFRGSLVQ